MTSKPPRSFRLVFTNGCYDAGLTRAHVELLQFAKRQGDYLLVALNSDESVRQLKGPSRPVLPLADRMAIVAALGCVDHVVSFDTLTPLETIKEVKPDIIVKGGDYKPEEVVGFGLAEVIIFPWVDCLTTAEKLRRLARRNENDN